MAWGGAVFAQPPESRRAETKPNSLCTHKAFLILKRETCLRFYFVDVHFFALRRNLPEYGGQGRVFRKNSIMFGAFIPACSTWLSTAREGSLPVRYNF